MKKDNSQLRNLISSAKTLSAKLTTSIRSNLPIEADTQNLLGIVNQLIPLIIDKYKGIANVLTGAIGNIKNYQVIWPSPYGQPMNKEVINLYSLRDIMTAINILDSLVEDLKPNQNSPKIFISHSSADEAIVKAFMEKILLLGCQFSQKDIFCTLDHTAIRTGEDFRNVIVENMKACDYIICMISDNYKKSEVCQIELGAAWAFEGKRVLPFKFPNVKFTELGFLNVVKQAADITDSSKLDELYVELSEYYDLKQDFLLFNKRKEDFIKVIKDKVELVQPGSTMTANVTKDVVKDVVKERTDKQQVILELIKVNPTLSINEMSKKTGLSMRTIHEYLASLHEKGILTREGGRKDGKWVIKNL